MEVALQQHAIGGLGLAYVQFAEVGQEVDSRRIGGAFLALKGIPGGGVLLIVTKCPYAPVPFLEPSVGHFEWTSRNFI